MTITKSKVTEHATYLTYLIVVLLITILVIGAFNPGCLNEDTIDQWGQAATRTYHDWHPATLSIIWSYMRELYNGVQVVIFFDVVLFSVGMLLVVRVCRSHLVRLGLLVAATLFIPVFVYLGFVGSDSFIACLLLCGVGLYYLYAESQRPFAFWAALLVLYLAYSVRPNSIFAVVPILGLFLSTRWAARKAIIALFVCFVAFLAMERTTRYVFDVRHEYPQQAEFLYDLSALSLHSDKILIPPSFRTPTTSLDGIRAQLSVYNASPLFFSQGNVCSLFNTEAHANHDLMISWLRGIARDPTGFLKWRLDVFLAFLGFRATVLQPYVESCIVPNNVGLVVVPSSLHRVTMAMLGPIAQSVVFRPYVYLALLLALMVFAVWRRRLDIFLVAAGGVCYTAGYFLISPGGVFRYACCSVFLLVVLVARLIAEQAAQRQGCRETDKRWLKPHQLVLLNSLFVAIAISVLYAAEPPPRTVDQLATAVPNGDFESGRLAPWSTFQGLHANIDPRATRTGRFGLSEAAGSGSVYVDITGLRAGARYLVSGWVSSPAFAGQRTVARIATWDAQSNVASTSESVICSPKWKKINKFFLASSTGNVRIHLLRDAGATKLFWDDIRISSSASETSNHISEH